jgi:hypothetical protein
MDMTSDPIFRETDAQMNKSKADLTTAYAFVHWNWHRLTFLNLLPFWLFSDVASEVENVVTSAVDIHFLFPE